MRRLPSDEVPILGTSVVSGALSMFGAPEPPGMLGERGSFADLTVGGGMIYFVCCRVFRDTLCSVTLWKDSWTTG